MAATRNTSGLILSLVLPLLLWPPTSSLRQLPCWNTLHGNAPVVIAKGGFSGLFPVSSEMAYKFARSTVPEAIMYCDVRLTKDARGICLPNIDLGNSTTISSVYPREKKSYLVNGEPTWGWFSVDYTTTNLQHVYVSTLIRWTHTSIMRLATSNFSINANHLPMDINIRSAGRGRIDHVLEAYQAEIIACLHGLQVAIDLGIGNVESNKLKTLEHQYLMDNRKYFQAKMFNPNSNVKHDSFYAQFNLSMKNYILSVLERVVVDYISSPDVSLLRSLHGRIRGQTKLLFRFLDDSTVIEPYTNMTFGTILQNLTFVKSFACGILVPKSYISPVSRDNYLEPYTSIVSDAHEAGSEIYASDFANDQALSYNYSFDPTSEILSYIDNGVFSVDGILADFHITPH